MDMMVRVSRSKRSGKIVSRRLVEVRVTKAGNLYARQAGHVLEERFWRIGKVWRLKRPRHAVGPFSFEVWLEEEKDGN